MLGVGVGDGIVNRLCCALVVVEKIRGPDGEFLSIKSFVSIFLCDLRRKVSCSGINFRQIRIDTGDSRTCIWGTRSDSETDFDHKLPDPNKFVACKCDSYQLSFMCRLCSHSLKLRAPANQTKEYKETVARNGFPLLVTDVSKVSVSKADSRIGLLTARTGVEENRSVLRCDPSKMRSNVATRREVTKLEISSSPHIRD